MDVSGLCLHCKSHCGRIVARGLGERCYMRLRKDGRLDEYAKHMTGRKATLYHITADMHERIKAVYQDRTGDNQVNQLAAELGLPRWKVTKYAISQGWMATQAKEPNWGPEELALLKEHARHNPEYIQARLKEHGYKRGCVGIVLKRKRLGLLQDLGGISATALSNLLGVDIHYVTDRIRSGMIKAESRITKRTAQQGGDTYFIVDADIRVYVLANLHEIDIRKVDKEWFVNLLTRGERSDVRRGDDPVFHITPEPERPICCDVDAFIYRPREHQAVTPRVIKVTPKKARHARMRLPKAANNNPHQLILPDNEHHQTVTSEATAPARSKTPAPKGQRPARHQRPVYIPPMPAAGKQATETISDALIRQAMSTDEYFHCTKMSCRLRKVVCVLRQQSEHFDIQVQCGNCAQGRAIAQELSVKQAA